MKDEFFYSSKYSVSVTFVRFVDGTYREAKNRLVTVEAKSPYQAMLIGKRKSRRGIPAGYVLIDTLVTEVL